MAGAEGTRGDQKKVRLEGQGPDRLGPCRSLSAHVSWEATGGF